MSKIVPLISSGTAGPLGVLHLPRLWQKVSLEAADKLADGYPGIGAGYDSMVIQFVVLSLIPNRLIHSLKRGSRLRMELNWMNPQLVH